MISKILLRKNVNVNVKEESDFSSFLSSLELILSIIIDYCQWLMYSIYRKCERLTSYSHIKLKRKRGYVNETS